MHQHSIFIFFGIDSCRYWTYWFSFGPFYFYFLSKKIGKKERDGKEVPIFLKISFLKAVFEDNACTFPATYSIFCFVDREHYVL